MSITIGTASRNSPKGLRMKRRMNDTEHGHAIDSECRRDGDVIVPMDEICCAVERIDDPARPLRGVPTICPFLGEDGVAWESLCDALFEVTIDSEIRVGDDLKAILGFDGEASLTSNVAKNVA